MPTYDYKCTECDNVFEKFHGISENPEVLCPECSAKAEKQIAAGAGIHFKGSGFYVTDYKKSGSASTETKTANKADSAAGTCGPGCCKA